MEIGASYTSGIGVLERSGKGGLHGIMSASAVHAINRGAGIRPPQSVVDWIVANPNHSYYLSTAFRMTRFGDHASDVSGISLSASPSRSAQSLLSIGDGNGPYPAAAARIGYRLADQPKVILHGRIVRPPELAKMPVSRPRPVSMFRR